MPDVYDFLFLKCWECQHLKDHKDPIMESVWIETKNILAHGIKDLPLTLCFATQNGDEVLLGQLLRRGLDPDKSDNGGRTPLVCKRKIS